MSERAMTKSTGKMRDWILRLYTPNTGELKVQGLDILDEIEREVAERYMELPVDADGVPIHVGDWMRHCDFIVQCAAVSPKRVYYWDECKDGHWVMGVKCRHVKPRTVEDVLMSAGVSVAIIEDVASELRELMEVDA